MSDYHQQCQCGVGQTCDVCKPPASPPLPAPAGSTLGDALPKEIARCQDLLAEYRALGPVGAWGYAAISRDIANAHKAMMEGDVVAMLKAYNDLRGCK